MGLTGLEPVTLRLSSACSNQLSYRPGWAAQPPHFRLSVCDFRFGFATPRAHLLKSAIANRKSKINSRARGSRIRNVALRTHDLKRISDIAHAEPLGCDHKERCTF